MKFLLILSALVCYASCQLSPLELVFHKLGTFTGNNVNGIKITKNYYVPKYYKATWLNAKVTCNLYGMDLAGFESLEEQEVVKNMCLADPGRFSQWTFVDGMTTVGGSKTEWYLSSGKKIPYALNWFPNGAEPGFQGQRQWCLAVGDIPNRTFHYADYDCSTHDHQYEQKFLCQEIVASG